MEDFLPAMRTNMLSKKRPFGMPDIDDGDVGKMFNDVLPFVNQLKQQDEIRRRDRMAFDRSMQPRPQLSMTDRAYGATAPGNATPMTGTVSAPSSFSPMQRQFQLRDEEERQQKFRAGEAAQDRANKLAGIMDEAKLRDAGETARLGQTLSARTAEGTADRASREALAEKELQAKMAENQTERTFRSGEGAASRASAERIAGMPSRTAPDPGKQFDATVQDFKIQNPDLADRVVYDETSKSYKLNTQGLTPAQLSEIQKKLQPQAKAGPKMITQRNKKTGETRQVPVR